MTLPSDDTGVNIPVAIIVIAFNEERRIAPCLRALLAQRTATPFEVVVVDDGSSDATAAVVEGLCRDHPNMRLVRHDRNLGRGAARRSGQDATGAAFVGFVDADIIVPTTWLDRCLHELASADGVSGIAQPDGDSAVLWRICRPTLRLRRGSAEITGNNVLFSREALRRVPFSRDAKLGEDFRLAKIMTRAGLRLRTIDDLVVEHHETKTYWKAVTWMWQSGVDATSLLFEFRVVRLPDLAWMAWFAGVTIVVVTGAVGELGPWVAVALIVATTAFVDALFIASRFDPRTKFARFLGALAISPPMMLAYLLGRSVGLAKAPFSSRATVTSA